MALVYLSQPQGDLLVGRISRIPGGDQSIFTLDEDYRTSTNPRRPLLSLSLFDSQGQLKQNTKVTNTKLHPWFSNLLPEGHLRKYIAEQYGFHQERDLPLILVLGQDLPGAVIVHLEDEDQGIFHSSYQEGSERMIGGPLKFSLAGIQLKFSAVRESTGGLTIPAQGYGGSWIVKLPSEVYQSVPENEFDMMRLARLVGFAVPEIDLIEMGKIDGLPKGIRREQRAFVIRRFDREASGKRIHMEDFAQIFGLYPQNKYQSISYGNIVRVIHATMGDAGVHEFIARLVFNAAIGNGDMHAKNWSILYPDGVTPGLAPPYDYVSTLSYVNSEETLALSMAGTKRFQDLSLSLLKTFARKTHLPEGIVLDAAKRTVDCTWTMWSVYKQMAESPKIIVESIDRHMRNLPIFREVLGQKVVVSNNDISFQQVNRETQVTPLPSSGAPKGPS